MIMLVLRTPAKDCQMYVGEMEGRRVKVKMKPTHHGV
jgi:hypothetical protein